MDRLSDWRAAAWVAFCLAAIAAAAAVIVPAATRSHGAKKAQPVARASISPRTHLFGQAVTATLEVPARLRVKATFAPYRVVRRSVTRTGSTVRYRYTLDCLRAACIGPPGQEHAVRLPPVRIVFPNGRTFVGLWPVLRQASRLGPTDLKQPRLRGDLTAPDAPRHDRNLATGLLFAIGGGIALLGAGALGFRRLAWRPRPQWETNGRRDLSPLDYALVVTGLAAGGGQENRRAALESLAIALEERGLGDLAAEARSIAWSPEPPAGEAVRRLADDVQQLAKGAA